MKRRGANARHFALTWAIDVDHGGMTAALLHRSRLLAQAGAAVNVLTFDDDRDYVAISQRLRDRGVLVAGVQLLNLWDWLEGAPRRHPMRVRLRYADDGKTVVQTDHLRADGSVLVTDRRDVRRRGVVGGRQITLFDAIGRPVQRWKSKWTLYRYWLDQLAGDAAVMIADSKTVSPFLASYRRRNVLTGHVVHGSHLADDGATLRRSRAATIERLDQFDFIVALTDRQRSDLRSLSPRAMILTVPNPVSMPSTIELNRPVTSGAMVCSLTPRKRVGDAIDAVNCLPDEITLDVYGDGPQRAALTMNARTGITIHGHEPNAARHLEQHSFILLTSRSEGSPLALTEAMAAGCIPIAYDIPYGPADLITHDRTGYLVPEGDVAGIATSIQTLTSLAPERIEQMREACRDRVRRLDEETTRTSWERAIQRAWRRKLGVIGRVHRYLHRRFQPPR